jgi:hypothetical protein
MDKQVKFFFEVQPAFLNRGIFLLKSQEFLSFQMHQLVMMIISIAKGRHNVRLKCKITLSVLIHGGIIIPIIAQQFLTKAHLKNKRLKFSSLCQMHISHA